MDGWTRRNGILYIDIDYRWPNSEARAGTREIFIFPVQLTTRRIGNLTRLIHTHAICDGPYIHTYSVFHGRSGSASLYEVLVLQVHCRIFCGNDRKPQN